MSWSAPSVKRCPACKKPVYAAEQIIATDRTPYHRGCVRCVSCFIALSPGSLTEHEGQLYCRVCYNRFQVDYAAYPGSGTPGMSEEDRLRMERERQAAELERQRQAMMAAQNQTDGKGRNMNFTELDILSLTTIAPTNEILANGL